MSQENVEILREGFEQFARGDVEAVLERLDPDVDWRPAIAPILGVETVRGRDAVREFFTRDLFGLEIDQTFASLYRLRDGKTVSMRDYSTRAEALEAAGLRE